MITWLWPAGGPDLLLGPEPAGGAWDLFWSSEPPAAVGLFLSVILLIQIFLISLGFVESVFLEIHFPSFHLVFFSHTTPSNFHMQHNHYNTLSVGTSKLSLDEKRISLYFHLAKKCVCTHTE